MSKQGLTQVGLAKVIGVRRQVVSGALAGTKGIPRAWLKPIAAALNIQESDLLRGIDWRPGKGRPSRTGPPPPKPKRKERTEDVALRQRLRHLIQSRRLTQREVACGIGVSRACVNKVLAGRMAVPPAWLKPLACLLSIEVSEVLRGTGWTKHQRGLARHNRRHA